MDYLRPEHQIIAGVLRGMNADLLANAECWFGGGTAIVMTHGEYRRSLDLDFLCASTSGYRLMREACLTTGYQALFAEDVKLLREVRADQYGIRMAVEANGQPIKFEIIKEARIALDGTIDADLGVPMLTRNLMFAEKLLANADRCQDRAAAYRDALDLGRLVEAAGEIPLEAVSVAENVYGPDIARKVGWVVNHLQDDANLRPAAEAMDMQFDDACAAIRALRKAAIERWPEVGIIADKNDGKGCGM